MIRQGYKRLAAWLGLFAMFMAFAGPVYSQLRALESLPLAYIDLDALHCGDQDAPAKNGPPAWVHHLEQCGYCSLLASNPALASAFGWSLPGSILASVELPSPEQGHFQQPLYRPLARGPPVIHV